MLWQTVCTTIAVILHYLFLAAFFLMLAEGCLITHMVLTPLHKKNIAQSLIAVAFGIFFKLKYTIYEFKIEPN